MTTFDAWDAGLRPPENYLMHFRTKGSKNGVRRYQLEDGTWTKAGLEARKKREGWGERRVERKAARKERKAERSAARAEAKAAYKEKVRQRNPKTMTKEELADRIERLKMENEYRELKKSPLLKAGEKFISGYIQNKHDKEERAYNEKQQKLIREHELAKLKEQTQQTKLRSEADKERAIADKIRAETDRVDIEKGTRLVRLKNEKRNLKLQGRRLTSDSTIRGGIAKTINKLLSGNAENTVAIAKGYGDSQVALKRGKTDAKIAVKQARKLNRYNKRHPTGVQASIPAGGFPYGTQPGGGGKKPPKKK